MKMKNKNYFLPVVIFLCMGITWDIYKYKIANIAFCYNLSLKIENNSNRVQQNRMCSKIRLHSGITKSKVANMHKEKTKEL